MGRSWLIHGSGLDGLRRGIGLLGRGQGDDRFHHAGQLDGKAQRFAREARHFDALDFIFVQLFAVDIDGAGFLFLAGRGVEPGFQAVAPQHAAAARRFAVPLPGGQDIKYHILCRFAHHIGIHDVGVALGFIAMVILVGADFIILPGMLAQIQHAIAAHAAHARLEMTGFILIRHDADTAFFGIKIRAFESDIFSFRLHQQRLQPEIGFQWVVLFQYTNTQLSRQHNFPPQFKFCSIRCIFEPLRKYIYA